MGIILAGCAVPNRTTTPTEMPVTEIPSPMTASPAPNETVIVPTPVFPAEQVAHSLILSTGQSEDCQLPCWHGLQIGEARQEDVQDVFTMLLNPAKSYNFFAPPINEGLLPDQISHVPGSYAGGQTWYIELTPPNGPLGSYYLYAVMDQETGHLMGIIEEMTAFGQYDVPNLPETIARLGKPSWIYGGANANTSYEIGMFYPNGIIVFIGITQVYTEQANLACLDHDPYSIGIILVDPYININEEDLSPLQQRWGLPDEPAPYIVENMGTSVDSFVDFINSDNPCITISF